MESKYTKIVHRKSPLISAEDFSDVPDEILKRLKKAAIDADMDKVDQIVEEIREIQPELANGLAAPAADFEYGRISRMIEDVNG